MLSLSKSMSQHADVLQAGDAAAVLIGVATASVASVVLTEGFWNISTLNGTIGQILSFKAQLAATAAPLFAALSPVPATVSEGLGAMLANLPRIIYIQKGVTTLYLAHNAGATLDVLLSRHLQVEF